MVIEPFQGFRDLVCTIPGIGALTADVIIAETGADMTRFPSSGQVKSTKTRPSNPYLRGALGTRRCRSRRTPPPTSAPDTPASRHDAGR